MVLMQYKSHLKLKHSVDKAVTLDFTPMKLADRLKTLINRHNITVFMKGNRDTPSCGFSRTLIQILNGTGTEIKKKYFALKVPQDNNRKNKKGVATTREELQQCLGKLKRSSELNKKKKDEPTELSA